MEFMMFTLWKLISEWQEWIKRLFIQPLSNCISHLHILHILAHSCTYVHILAHFCTFLHIFCTFLHIFCTFLPNLLSRTLTSPALLIAEKIWFWNLASRSSTRKGTATSYSTFHFSQFKTEQWVSNATVQNQQVLEFNHSLCNSCAQWLFLELFACVMYLIFVYILLFKYFLLLACL